MPVKRPASRPFSALPQSPDDEPQPVDPVEEERGPEAVAVYRRVERHGTKEDHRAHHQYERCRDDLESVNKAQRPLLAHPEALVRSVRRLTDALWSFMRFCPDCLPSGGGRRVLLRRPSADGRRALSIRLARLLSSSALGCRSATECGMLMPCRSGFWTPISSHTSDCPSADG